jgi:hypothetical protein
MSKYLRCSSCGGSKQIMGGGMMMVKCDRCDGRGMMEIFDDVNELSPRDEFCLDHESEETEKNYKRKPGRPKRDE